MIDFHTHILPDIDDGASNIHEALALIEALTLEGFEAAVCTPHFDPSVTSLEDFVRLRNEAAKELAYVNMKLILGSETYLHEYLFHYSDLSPLCIENTRYLLVEMPFYNKWDDNVYTMIYNLISYYNIIPIVAHIERYPAVRFGSSSIKKLINCGCLIQLNTSSLVDKRLKKRAIKYLQKGYIDVLGSDCHNMTSRPPVLKQAIDEIQQRLGREYFYTLKENAIKILDGEEINM